MQTTTISEFRKDLQKYIDDVINNYDTLIVNKGKNTGVVVLSLDEYNSLQATNHELSSKANEQRLDSAIEKLENGKSFSKKLIEE